MIRKFVIIFFLFLFTFLYAPLLQVNFDDFTGGLNTKWSPNKLLLNQCVDVDNILFDKKLGLCKRDGYLLKATINSAGNYVNGIEYTKSTGDKYYILQKGSSLHKSFDLNSWDTYETGLNTSYDCRFVVYMNDLWRVNGNDTVSSYDGMTISNYSFIPKGRFIVVYNESIFIGNTTDEQSGLYFSDIVLGPKSSSAWKATYAFYVGRNDGDNITGLYVWNGILWIFKKNSIWGLSGYSIDDYVLRQYTNEFGCIDDRTIREKGNGLVFLSSKGLIRFDGASAEIISKLIEPSINDLSLNSKVNRNWTQSQQADFQLGTADNVDITNYPNEIRNSGAIYKSWTSSTDFSNPASSVNIDTITFSRNGFICNDVRLTDDFSSDVISSSWTPIINTQYPNGNWEIENGSLHLSTTALAYNTKGRIGFNNTKMYGKWGITIYNTNWDVRINLIQEFNTLNNTPSILITFLSNSDPYPSRVITYYNDGAQYIHNFFRSLSPPTTKQVLTVMRDYNGYVKTNCFSNNETVPSNKEFSFNSPAFILSASPQAIYWLGTLFRINQDTHYDDFYLYISTWSEYVSSTWDTTVSNPAWQVFNSSISIYGISDIGFQMRVSSSGSDSNWDSYIGISHGQTPTNASKRYVQWKATTTVNTLYEVLSPEIREVYISRVSSGSFTSQEKYVGTNISKWGMINIDDTDNIGYFIAGATSSYNLSIASYIAVSDGGTIPLNPSANYVKWKSTYTATINQITYGVMLNWKEGTGATGSERYTSAVFDDRYWLSCSSNNATNNIIYVADSNLAFTKFSNIPANILFEFNNKKYFASSSDNNIFEFNEINTDSGTIINSYWKAAHTHLDNPDVYKWLRYAFFTGRKQTGDFVYFDYSIDDSTVTTSQYVSFSDNRNVPKEFGQGIIAKNNYFAIRSTGLFELQGFSIYKEEENLNPIVP